jgi:hypothetical protein
MLPRGGKAAKRLDAGEFINFNGTLEVPEAFYRDMVSACGLACRSPSANRVEMAKFVDRNLEIIESFFEGWV